MRSLWDSRSILCGLSDLYELRLVRWNRGKEWSPWNCILLTKDEAELHQHLDNLNKVNTKKLLYFVQFRNKKRSTFNHSIIYIMLYLIGIWKLASAEDISKTYFGKKSFFKDAIHGKILPSGGK